MLSIPSYLFHRLQQVLGSCNEFANDQALQARFSIVDCLAPFKNGLPTANNLDDRVTFTIAYLYDKRAKGHGNALVCLLRILSEKYTFVGDERGEELAALKNALESYWLPIATTRAELDQANPAGVPMTEMAEIEKIVKSHLAVAAIHLHGYRNDVTRGGVSGTGWLITPHLFLTAWHVIEARNMKESPLATSDLDKQWQNMLVTFDFVAAVQGIQYSVAKLEAPSLAAHPLDFALLRLRDRNDAPLKERGYLRVDVDAPFTEQTALCIIQHPLGQTQKLACGEFHGDAPLPGRIFYTTPTEPGTSGAPVFNRANWKVMALHNGEFDGWDLNQGTRMSAVLAFIKEKYSKELYQEIMSAQRVKE